MLTAGIVLCGGASRRMGSAKGKLQFGAETLLQRAVRIQTSMVERVVAVAAPGQVLPALPPTCLIARDPVPFEGPLRGLVTGLETVRDLADVVFLSACDMPFLRAAFVARLFDRLADDDIAIPLIDGQLHPLAAVYRIGVQATALGLLSRGDRRLKTLTEICRTRHVVREELMDVDPALESLRNINTPQEYEAALRML